MRTRYLVIVIGAAMSAVVLAAPAHGQTFTRSTKVTRHESPHSLILPVPPRYYRLQDWVPVGYPTSAAVTVRRVVRPVIDSMTGLSSNAPGFRIGAQGPFAMRQPQRYMPGVSRHVVRKVKDGSRMAEERNGWQIACETLERASQLFAARSHGDARRLVSAAARKTPRGRARATLYSFLGSLEFAQAKLGRADSLYRRSLAEDPTSAATRLALARLLTMRRGRTTSALTHARRALRYARKPDDRAEAHAIVARCFLKQERLAPARQALALYRRAWIRAQNRPLDVPLLEAFRRRAVGIDIVRAIARAGLKRIRRDPLLVPFKDALIRLSDD